jgi:tRNA(fMet)-specific endonuclease VapC
MADIAISAVTEGELLYGLAKRGHPASLSERVRQFLLRVDVLDWDRDAAAAYGDLRTSCERSGVSLSPFDMMIAAHAVAADAVLISRDKAFAQVPPPLRTEGWAAEA